jgi:branched-chain amino acid transport system substrate-binding protein
MKKLVLAAVVLLLVPVVVTQWASLYVYGELRSWVAGRSPREILVGAAWPFAENRDGMADGLLLAEEEINVRGVRGKRFRLVLQDDNFDREQSRNISIDFARNPRMTAVIGYYDDNFAVRASAIFEESRLLHIVIGANNTYMTSHGFRYLIRSVLASDLIARKLVRLCQARGYEKFAVIAEDGPFGEDLSYQFGAELDVLDAHLVYQSSYVRTQVDFRETVNELRAVDADVIVFAGLEAGAAAFIKSARDMGLRIPIVGSFSDTPTMHEIAGKALEGVMFYEIYDADTPTPENRAFVAKFRKRFGREPGAYAAQSYDALQLLARAVAITGSSDPLDLSYAIRFMGRWEGANGSYKFDDRGELEDKDLYLRMYRGGQAVTVATSPVEQTPIRR